MAKIVGTFALIVTLMVGVAKPAAAEFFGCNDQHATALFARFLCDAQLYP